MKKSVVIVAGGSGARMNLNMPKQFVEILGKPIVVYTIEAFLNYDPNIKVVLVLPKAHFPTWENIKSKYLPNKVITIAQGGASRFQSVKAGLEYVEEGLVAIHDAVRLLVPPKVIDKSYKSAQKYGSGVAMVPLKDSIRKTDGDLTRSEDRQDFLLVQTPQTFYVNEIKSAFSVEEQANFTDDASVYEASSKKVRMVLGDYKNIKVTTPEDLLVAEAFLTKKE